jgi:hypothetical protein
VLGKRVVGFVAPLERDGVCGQLTDQLRTLHDDVAPELHAMAAALHARVHLLQKLEVYALGAALLAGCLRAALTEIESLVEPDVEHPALKVRQQLIVQLLEQGQAARIRRAQPVRLAAPVPRVLEAVGALCERTILIVHEPAMHVTEAVLIGHQLDEARRAVGVQLAHVLGRVRAGVLPYALVTHVRKRVLEIQLQLVDFPAREPIDERAQRGQRRHLSRLTSSITPRSAKSGASVTSISGRASCPRAPGLWAISCASVARPYCKPAGAGAVSVIAPALLRSTYACAAVPREGRGELGSTRSSSSTGPPSARRSSACPRAFRACSTQTSAGAGTSLAAAQPSCAGSSQLGPGAFSPRGRGKSQSSAGTEAGSDIPPSVAHRPVSATPRECRRANSWKFGARACGQTRLAELGGCGHL